MEITKPNSSLSQKLELLKTLRSGKIQQSEKILANLSTTSRTNPALYSKFHAFLSQHRKDIEDIENDEKEEEGKVVFVEGSDDSWITDDSVSLSSEEEVEESQEPQHEQPNERRLMKNLTNTKSTILLHSTKDVKRPFMVQTKLKEVKGHTSSTLKRGGSVTKLDFQNKSLLTTLSKSNLLSKNLTKQASRPYFPPINGAKSTLKLHK